MGIEVPSKAAEAIVAMEIATTATAATAIAQCIRVMAEANQMARTLVRLVFVFDAAIQPRTGNYAVSTSRC